MCADNCLEFVVLEGDVNANQHSATPTDIVALINIVGCVWGGYLFFFFVIQFCVTVYNVCALRHGHSGDSFVRQVSLF